jgi:hypothetical protein
MIKKLMRFWSEENGLTALLFFLSVEMFILHPMLRTGMLLGLMNASVFCLLLLAGLLTIITHRFLRVASGLFVLAAILVRWARVAGMPALLPWDALFSAVGLAGLTLMVLWAVFREGPVTGHRIRGAIAAYLLLAIFFAYVYGLIEYVCPGALRFPEGDLGAARGELHQGFLYFSVVTIATLGYGDIIPIHPWARSVVMLEAVIGPLYLAIFLARLVSLRVEPRRPPSADNRPDSGG